MKKYISLFVCLTTFFCMNAQINVKDVKNKAQSVTNTTKSDPPKADNAPNNSKGSVFDDKKVDMTKLEEKPAGTIKGLNLFYGAGYEIMKNTIGLVLSSSDGVNWKEEFKSQNIAIADVAYGEGKIVAVGGKTVFYTTDGKTWNSTEGTTNGILNGEYSSVAYGAGMFVACGTTATLSFSKDGETWIKYFGEELDPEYDAGVTHFYGVSFCNGKFYVVGNSQRIISLIPDEKDGLKKEKCTVLGQVTNRLDEVAYGNGAYVAVGAKQDFVSTDGLNWKETNPEWQIWGIGFANGLFVKACGFGRVFTSPDGSDNSWKETYQMSRTLFWDAAYGNNIWLVTGKDGVMLTSTDAVKWDYHSIKPCYTIKKVIFIE
ncbi:MAG: hypothetical protein JXB49_16225 [Bacteroidales bacterium]|nr:hypothetical protein [Bacteroidales bacterium]